MAIAKVVVQSLLRDDRTPARQLSDLQSLFVLEVQILHQCRGLPESLLGEIYSQVHAQGLRTGSRHGRV